MIFSMIIKPKDHGSDLTLWGPGVQAGPPSLLSPVSLGSRVKDELGKGGPVMSVYVGIDVHRKRSQVAVVTEDGKVQLNRNVVNGWSRS